MTNVNTNETPSFNQKTNILITHPARQTHTLHRTHSSRDNKTKFQKKKITHATKNKNLMNVHSRESDKNILLYLIGIETRHD